MSTERHIHAILQEASFSMVGVTVPQDIVDVVEAWAKRIHPDHIQKLETDLHVTIKFGIHTKNPDDVRSLRLQGPLIGAFWKTSLFDNPDSDVLFIPVVCQDLHRLNIQISNALEVTDTHPTYKPHLTIAYLHKGFGHRYCNDKFLWCRHIFWREIFFSTPEKKKTTIPLVGG